MSFCTLFDSNYLDKGIVMIDSLMRVSGKTKVYVLCMDSLCSNILRDYYDGEIEIIERNTLFDYCPKLYELETTRSRGELCWSCTALLIKYILLEKGDDICTYIDSDICFYANPDVLINEMLEKGCSVQVIPHNCPPNIYGHIVEKNNGKNCVQFNTFLNRDESMLLLDKWIDQCLDECSVENNGDQKYTDDWGKYNYVNISEYLGAGISTWNIARYYMREYSDNVVSDRYTGQDYKLVFIHFHDICYIDRNTVRVNAKNQSLKVDAKMIDYYYEQYIFQTEQIKRHLKDLYDFEPIVYSNQTLNQHKRKLLRWMGKYTFIEIAVLLMHKMISRIKNQCTYYDIKKIVGKHTMTNV